MKEDGRERERHVEGDEGGGEFRLVITVDQQSRIASSNRDGRMIHGRRVADFPRQNMLFFLFSFFSFFFPSFRGAFLALPLCPSV